MQVKATAKRHEVKRGQHTYRYGYVPVPETSDVIAGVECSSFRLPLSVCRSQHDEYCAQEGITEKFIPEDYGYSPNED